MQILIKNGTIVNESQSFVGNILIKDDRIVEITPKTDGSQSTAEDFSYAQEGVDVIDATDCFVFPGIIDTHVHFREPGLTHKADIESESRAAAYGGVTSFFDMPNCKPQTTTLQALAEKTAIAKEKSHVNYAFFFGATNDNADLFKQLDKRTIPGIKLFMGSSTGNMLVDQDEALEKIFTEATACEFPVMVHCEDSDIINENTERIRAEHGANAPVSLHPQIRSREACIASTKKAVELATTTGARLHVAHVSTKEELAFASNKITLEACVPHIVFCDKDYKTVGALMKCNPAVKTEADQEAIRWAIVDGRIATIATDHAPHTLEEKQGGCLTATSGMPMLQFSLVSMLEVFVEGAANIQDKSTALQNIAALMAHNPATLFNIEERGFIRKGHKADIAIVKRTDEPWTLQKEHIQSKCGWSPLEGRKFHWQVVHTICNGRHILNNGQFDAESRGEQIKFEQ